MNSISPSAANFNAVLDHLKCSITQSFAYDPVMCPCGHLFDLPAILTWLGTGDDMHVTCPVSRDYLRADMLRTNTVVRDILTSLGIRRPFFTFSPEPVVASTDTVSTQTEIDDVPELISPVLAVDADPPFVCGSMQEITTANLTGDEIDYLNGDRFWCLQDGMINPHTGELADLRDHLIQRNTAMINSLNVPSFPLQYVAIRKYSYQHSNSDITDVAHLLSSQGYFVFDLYRVSRRNGLNQYVLCSLDRRSHNRNNFLSRYRNSRNH